MALGVMLGAFGAHALKERLDAYSLDVYQTAVFYHFIHALGILIVSALFRAGALSESACTTVCALLLAGIVLFSGSLYALALTGSRGLGHQVCTDYVSQLDGAMRRYGLHVPDRQLACAPIHSPEGQRYLHAMAAAANFAWTNRQCIAHAARGAFKRILGETVRLPVIYDVAHNIAKVETHVIDGKPKRVVVHRKGATRAFPDQPVFIPGSMGTASYFLLGQEGAMRETFGSACHGAGRVLSRSAAKKGVTAKEIQKELESRGIIVESLTREGLTEEKPEAYKDIEAVVDVVHNAGLAVRVARLRPIGVVKG